MDKREFISTCMKCGYADKESVIKYTKDKNTFTDKDFIGIYRLMESMRDASTDHGKFRNNSTKRNKQSARMGSDRNL